LREREREKERERERERERESTTKCVRGETDGRRALAARVDAARRDLVHILQQLRLGGARVAAQQHVELAAEPTGAGGWRWTERERERSNKWTQKNNEGDEQLLFFSPHVV
jgi:hypothetical protein